VKAQAAERATPGAAPGDDDRILDGGEPGYLTLVRRVRQSLEGEFVEGIEVGTLEWIGWRFQHYRSLTVPLDQAFAAVGGLLGFDDFGQPHEETLVLLYFLPCWKLNAVGEIGGGGGFRAQEEGRAANAAQVGAAAVESVGDFANGRFAHAVDQDVGFGIGQDGRLEFVLPIIVVNHPAHAGFHAAEDDGESWERLSAHLSVDDRGVVGTFAGRAVLAVDVLFAFVPRGGVIREHRIEVPGRHAAEQAGAAHGLDRVDVLPVWLGDDADAVAFGLEDPADHGRAEGRVVHVGVTGDEQHVEHGPSAGKGGSLGTGLGRMMERLFPLAPSSSTFFPRDFSHRFHTHSPHPKSHRTMKAQQPPARSGRFASGPAAEVARFTASISLRPTTLATRYPRVRRPCPHAGQNPHPHPQELHAILNHLEAIGQEIECRPVRLAPSSRMST
jgi:hypothetical protein